MQGSSAIKVDQVSKTFGKQTVIDQISMEVAHSEIFGLLGPSGAGKTTLVKMIAGIEIADSGDIYLLNQRMPKLDMMKSIGYMAQSDALYTELTAKENLEFFAALFGLKGKERKTRIEEVMELVDLTADINKQIQEYSGGMKRRLSLAVALLHSPEVLILDEPTVGIDPLLRHAVWQELDRLSSQGTTIIVTTHVMDEAYRCQRLGMIREGKLIAVGSPQTLMEVAGASTLEQAFLNFGGVQE